MTKQQASAEMKYRLSIYILQVLLETGEITTRVCGLRKFRSVNTAELLAKTAQCFG